MLEGTIADFQMIHVRLTPDGPVDGVPTWGAGQGARCERSNPSRLGCHVGRGHADVSRERDVA